jgi:hypothetical protein
VCDAWYVGTNEARYEYVTASKSGMTIEELAAWIQNAKDCGVPLNARPNVMVTDTGGIKKIEASGR